MTTKPIDAWRPWVQAGLVAIAAVFLFAFFDPFDWGWARVVGQLRDDAVEKVTLVSVAVFFLLTLFPLSAPSSSPTTWRAIAYVCLMLTLTLWWILSTVTSGMGPVTESLLTAQLFLSGASISVLRNTKAWPSDLEDAPARYVLGFIIFCGALFLMWADTEYWWLVGDGQLQVVAATPEAAQELTDRASGAADGWRTLNAIIIGLWLAGGLAAFTKPRWLGWISVVGSVALVVVYIVLENIDFTQ